jgi:hypothetical protein
MQRQELQGGQDLFLYQFFFQHVRKSGEEMQAPNKQGRVPVSFLLVLQLGAVQCAVHILGDGNGIP